MAKARAIIKRRNSVQNIRKITRTMELIATARFKKALDRATEAEAYTRKMAEVVADLGSTDQENSHPLLEVRPTVKKSALLILSSNRGLAGGYNGNVLRAAIKRYEEARSEGQDVHVEVAGKRGIAYCKFRKLPVVATYTQFEDRPQFDQIEPIADAFINLFINKDIDRLDVVYTRFVSVSRQYAVIDTLLPMSSGSQTNSASTATAKDKTASKGGKATYDFLPDSASILAEIVPASFKARLFKCFLDAAVSEQISRMVAMKGATQNADEMIKTLTRLYNRARQGEITSQLSEVIGGAAALE